MMTIVHLLHLTHSIWKIAVQILAAIRFARILMKPGHFGATDGLPIPICRALETIGLIHELNGVWYRGAQPTFGKPNKGLFYDSLSQTTFGKPGKGLLHNSL